MITRITTTSTLPTPHSAFRTRSGMSMAEVLVALFLMALGSIAILTMFPLGMYHMGQALKDDRTAQSASQADAFMRMYWRQNVVENQFVGNSSVVTFPGYEPFVAALDYPDSKPDLQPLPLNPVTRRDSPPGSVYLPIPSGQPGYPVFVDPMGWLAPWNTQNPNPYQLQYWTGGLYFSRRSLNLALNQPNTAAQRMVSMMDGFGYNENGTPSGTSGAIEREMRYNWLWVIQRPDNSNRNTASMTVVVFDKRAFQYAPQNAEAVFASQYPTAFPFFTAPGNASNTIVMSPLTTTIQIPLSLQPSPIQVQKGGWILDSTYLLPGNPFATQGMRHAIFYRVVSVTDNTGNGTTDLELQTPIRRLDGGTGAYPGTLIFMAGVSEVFERPNLTPNDY